MAFTTRENCVPSVVSMLSPSVGLAQRSIYAAGAGPTGLALGTPRQAEARPSPTRPGRTIALDRRTHTRVHERAGCTPARSADRRGGGQRIVVAGSGRDREAG
jgi:hypothetical protein